MHLHQYPTSILPLKTRSFLAVITCGLVFSLVTHAQFKSSSSGTIDLPPGTGSAVFNVVPDGSMLEKWFLVFGANCYSGCQIVAVMGNRFSTAKEMDRRKRNRRSVPFGLGKAVIKNPDEKLVDLLSKPSSEPFQLIIFDQYPRDGGAVAYEFHMDTWDGRISLSSILPITSPTSSTTVRHVRITHEFFLDLIRKRGEEGDIDRLRSAATAANLLYPSEKRMQLVNDLVLGLLEGEIKERMATARGLESRDKWEDAFALMKKIRAEFPESDQFIQEFADTKTASARESSSDGNYLAAITEIKKVLDLYPEDGEAIEFHRDLHSQMIKKGLEEASALEEEGRFRDALKIIDNLEPIEETVARLGGYTEELQRLFEFRQNLKTKIAREEEKLAGMERKRARQDRAESHARTLRELKSRFSQSMRAEKFEDALAALTRLVEIDPNGAGLGPLVLRAGNEIPLSRFRSHSEAEYFLRITNDSPAKVLKSGKTGQLIDWHSSFVSKTIDNWYVFQVNEEQFVIKRNSELVGQLGGPLKIIGRVDGIRTIGTIDGTPRKYVVVRLERLD